MRIAIFTDSFLPQVNGIVTVTISLAEHLAERGHRVYIVAPQYKNVREYRHRNVIVKRIASVPAFFYEEFRFTPFPNLEIINYLRKEKVQLIHFQTPVTLGLQALMTARVLKVPLVGTYHTLFSDPQYLRHVRLGSRVAQRLSWRYAAMYYDRCDLVTCPTGIIRKELVKHGFKRPIIAISNGIELDGFEEGGPRAKALRRKYAPHGPLLLFTGRIAYEKNIRYLLDCFAKARKELPAARLLIVGSGPQLQVVRSHAAALGLDGSVIFTGAIEHGRLKRSGILRACDLFVTASTTETQCISILEAQANGLPCIGIRAQGVAEAIHDGEDGLLVKSNDKAAFARAILRLLRDDALRRRMGRNAQRNAQRHDMAAIADVWERQYEALIQKRHGKVI